MSTLDIDAIQTRADVATPGEWNVYNGVAHNRTTKVRGIGSTGIPEDECILEDPYLHPIDAEFIAHAREDVPALVSLVRELQVGIPARAILDGDPEAIEKALDALPLHAVVTCDAFNEPGVWLKESTCVDDPWCGSGQAKPSSSRYLARYCAPLTVIR